MMFSDDAKLCPSVRNGRRMRRAGIGLGFTLAMAAAAPVIAEPRTIEDCEKIQAADAYNQCLASFGPVAHEHGVSADPEGANMGHIREEHAAQSAETFHSRWRGRWRRYEYAARPHDPWAHIRHAGRHRATFIVK